MAEVFCEALDSAKFRSISLEYKDIFQIAKSYAQQFAKELKEFRSAHGCAWDLPKEAREYLLMAVSHVRSHTPRPISQSLFRNPYWSSSS